MRNAILGSNTEAMIFQIFNPTYVCLAHDGFKDATFPRFTNNIIDSIILLESNKYNELLISKLFPFEYQREDIGETVIDITYRYEYDGDVIHPSNVDKKRLIRKKLAVKTLPVNFAANKGIHFCKQQSNKLRVIDVTASAIREALKRKAVVCDINHIGRILSIDEHAIHGTNEDYFFDHAISTIPADIMYQYCNGREPNKDVFKSAPSRLYLLESEQYVEPNIQYIIDETSSYCRINTIGHHTVVDITYGSFNAEDFPGKKLSTMVTVPRGKIVNNQLYVLPPNIEPLGRFAQWNPDIKIEDIVKRSIGKPDISEVWQRQKNILLAYQERPDDIVGRQELTKEYIIHMIHESTSLLNEINWKMTRKDKELVYDNIVQEWVDIFKYWLSIGLIWDINISDFLEMDKQRSIYAMEKADAKKTKRNT